MEEDLSLLSDDEFKSRFGLRPASSIAGSEGAISVSLEGAEEAPKDDQENKPVSPVEEEDSQETVPQAAPELAAAATPPAQEGEEEEDFTLLEPSEAVEVETEPAAPSRPAETPATDKIPEADFTLLPPIDRDVEIESEPVIPQQEQEPSFTLGSPEDIKEEDVAQEDITLRRNLDLFDAFRLGNSGTVLSAATRLAGGESQEKRLKELRDEVDKSGFFNPGSSLAQDIAMGAAYTVGMLFTPETFFGFGAAKAVSKLGTTAVAAITRNGGASIAERLVFNTAKSGIETAGSVAVGEASNLAVDVYKGQEVDPETIVKRAAVNVVTGSLAGGLIGTAVTRAIPREKVVSAWEPPTTQTSIEYNGVTYEVNGTGSWADTASRFAENTNIGTLESIVITSGIKTENDVFAEGSEKLIPLQAYTTNYVRQGANPTVILEELRNGFRSLGLSSGEAHNQAAVMVADATKRVRAESTQMTDAAWQDFLDSRPVAPTKGQIVQEESLLANVQAPTEVTKEAKKLFSQITGMPSKPGLVNQALLNWHTFTNWMQRTIFNDGAFHFKLLAQSINRSVNPTLSVLLSRNGRATRYFENINNYPRQALEGRGDTGLIPASLSPTFEQPVKSLSKIFRDHGRNFTQERRSEILFTLTDLDNQISNRMDAEKLLSRIDKNVQTDADGNLFVIGPDKQKLVVRRSSAPAEKRQYVFDEKTGERYRLPDDDLEAYHIDTVDDYATLQAKAEQLRADPTVKAFLDDLRQFNDWLLEMYRGAGRLSQEEVALIKQKNPNYTPSVRLKESIDDVSVVEPSVGSALKRRAGSKTVQRQEAAQAYWSSVSKNMITTELMAQDREVFLALLDLPDEQFSEIVLGVDKATFLRAIKDIQAGKKGGLLTKEGEFLSKNIRQEADKTILKRDDQLLFYINGKRVTVQVDTQSPLVKSMLSLQESVRNRGEKNLARSIANLGQSYAAWQRFGISILDMGFASRQWVKDQQDAMAKLPPEVRAFRDWTPFWSSLRAGFNMTKYFDENPEIAEALGYTGKSQMGKLADATPEQQRKQIESALGRSTLLGSERLGRVKQAVDAFFNAYEMHMITRLEMGPRISAYRAARSVGYSAEEAIVVAKEVSGNYWAKSSSEVVRNLYRTSAYLGAQFAGANDFFRRLRYEPERIARYGISAILLPSMAIHAWNFDQVDEDGRKILDQIPRHVLDNNWVIIKPKEDRIEGEAPYTSFPVGFSAAKIFWLMSKGVFDAAYTGDKKAEEALRAAGSIITSTIPSPSQAVPNIAEPGMRQLFNLDPFGRSIISPKMEDLPAEEQVKPKTSATAIAIGEATDISPLRVEVLLKDIFVGAYQVGVDLVGQMLTRAGIAPESPQEDLIARLVPFPGLMAAGSDPDDQGHVTRFWNVFQVVREKSKEYDELKRQYNDVPTAEEYEELRQFESDAFNMQAVDMFKEMEVVSNYLKQEQEAITNIVLEKVDVATPEKEFSGDPNKKAELSRRQAQVAQVAARFMDGRVYPRLEDELDPMFRSIMEVPPVSGKMGLTWQFIGESVLPGGLAGTTTSLAQQLRDFNAWVSSSKTDEEINNESTSNSDMD